MNRRRVRYTNDTRHMSSLIDASVDILAAICAALCPSDVGRLGSTCKALMCRLGADHIERHEETLEVATDVLTVSWCGWPKIGYKIPVRVYSSVTTINSRLKRGCIISEFRVLTKRAHGYTVYCLDDASDVQRCVYMRGDKAVCILVEYKDHPFVIKRCSFRDQDSLPEFTCGYMVYKNTTRSDMRDDLRAEGCLDALILQGKIRGRLFEYCGAPEVIDVVAAIH